MGVTTSSRRYCQYCGTSIHLCTIFNRDMEGFAKTWKRRHEHSCKSRTPKQRRQWAARYTRKPDTALEIDLEHPGFSDSN